MTAASTLSSPVEHRLTKLERETYACPNGYDVDDSMRRARDAVQDAAIYSAVWKWVPSYYYSWPLEQRAECLTGSSQNIDFLCKSLVMENKKIANNSKGDKSSDPKTNPQVVLVIIQYAASFSNKKLATAIRSLRPIHDRIDLSRFDFRIASSEDNDRLTGYKHNSVTPFGLLSPDVPIVLTKEVVDRKYFWMGGGHVDLKLRVATSEFIEKMNPIVADISDPREDYTDLD
ncbi:hypothetical protein ACA910_013495 [Epithemia clementina (nom. ined.)]